MFTLDELDRAEAIVYAHMPPTPQYRVATARRRARDGGVGQAREPHADRRVQGPWRPRPPRSTESAERRGGIISATRGNHGQSLAFAGRANGVPVVIVAPHGNSVEKNAAMRALGAELIESGHDFQAALEEGAASARSAGW